MNVTLHLRKICLVYEAQSVNEKTGKLQTKNKKETLTKGADKSLARPGRKQATVTEDFDFHYPIYNPSSLVAPPYRGEEV